MEKNSSEKIAEEVEKLYIYAIKNMLDKGMDYDSISKYINKSVEEIKQIEKSLNQEKNLE